MPVGDPTLTIERAQLPLRVDDEWLLTNGLGGFALGSASAIPARRYHAWLTVATTPPLGRIVALASCAEWLVVRRAANSETIERFDLSSFRFTSTDPAGAVSPSGHAHLARFERTATSVRWTYDIPQTHARVTRELFLFRHANAASIRYTIDWTKPPHTIAEAWLEVRPFTPLRDFHSLVTTENDADYRTGGDDDRSVRVATRAGAVTIALHGAPYEEGDHTARFSHGRQWWRNFLYSRDRDRGQDHTEHWFTPGAFLIPLGGTGVPPMPSAHHTFELRATVSSTDVLPPDTATAQRTEEARLQALTDKLAARSAVKPLTPAVRAAAHSLTLASDQFIVRRETHGAHPLTSIIAGYPWFSDWGRDAMISLPGLLLSFNRLDEARDVLTAFASLRRRGLIPNCFDNGSGQAQYNTVDASLWFIHACCEYLRAGGDAAVFSKTLRPACMETVDAYRAGTDYEIRMDASDGLVSAGNARTQLTWMDAQRNGVVFTPRAGKAVEVNALWYSALRSLAAAVEKEAPRTARELSQVADLTARNFEPAFWNAKASCLFDLAPRDPQNPTPEAEAFRPNQIFAVSLPHSPLSREKQQAVVLAVHKQLMTPMGLRTLSRAHPSYRARYEGDLAQRDSAYHQGTVWPWLLGPFVEALLRIENFSAPAKARARDLLTPLLAELTRNSPTTATARCTLPIASLAEVYDADEVPELNRRRPDGCPMQAWTIAELVRAWVMTG